MKTERVRGRQLTILPGFRVDRRQLGGSVVPQLKHFLRRYCVSFEAASSVCMTGMELMAGLRKPGGAETLETEEEEEEGR
jgi:hypothetical protein